MKFITNIFIFFVVTGSFSHLRGEEAPLQAEVECEESASEDLMHEHGMLSRLLLIYSEIIRRIDNNEYVPLSSVIGSAEVVRDFIENHHEKLEEQYIFPRFIQAQVHIELVKTLFEQHQVGRLITESILNFANEDVLANPEQTNILVGYLRHFVRMYRPHHAREDTVLLPALRKLITPKEYEELGELFEEEEHQLFGPSGFKTALKKVKKIERELGIYHLAQFTQQK